MRARAVVSAQITKTIIFTRLPLSDTQQNCTFSNRRATFVAESFAV